MPFKVAVVDQRFFDFLAPIGAAREVADARPAGQLIVERPTPQWHTDARSTPGTSRDISGATCSDVARLKPLRVTTVGAQARAGDSVTARAANSPASDSATTSMVATPLSSFLTASGHLAGSTVLAAFQSIALRTRRSTDGCE